MSSGLAISAGPAASAALTRALQLAECAADRGERITGNPHHAGAAKAYRHALYLAVKHCPGALGAAMAVLDEDVDGLTRAEHRQRLAAEAACPAEPLEFISSPQSLRQAQGDNRFKVVTAPPLCIECTHHTLLPEGQWRKGQSNHQCTHPQLRNALEGATECCAAARSDPQECGRGGRLFAAQSVGDDSQAVSQLVAN